MKKLITFILICFCISQSAYSQTYLQGEGVTPLSDAASCEVLAPAKRLSTEEAFTKLTQIDPDPFEKSVKDMVGESWWIDGMLVNIVTRKITTQIPKEDLKDTQKASAPEIRYIKGTTPDRSMADDYFSEIKSVNNFEVLVDYYKTRSHYKYFLIQDNNGKFKVMGTIYVDKSNAPKAHTLINTILNSLKFKE